METLQIIPTLFVKISAFLLTISFLVFIHEFGHFWMARRFGVRIEKFSIGFGGPIVKWMGKRDQTEYSLSWIPLGGYVKMYGESSTGTSKTDSAKTENTEKENTKNLTDTVDMAASSAETLISYNTTGSFSALSPFKRFLIAFAGPAVNILFAILAFWLLFMLGVKALPPVIGGVNANSAASQAGLQTGDKLTRINGKTVLSLEDASLQLINGLGNPALAIEFSRADEHKQTSIDFTDYQAGDETAIDSRLGIQWQFEKAWQAATTTQLAFVGNDTPAAKAGLLVGDVLLRFNTRPVEHWEGFSDAVKLRLNQPTELIVLRNNQQIILSLMPEPHPQNAKIGYAGISPHLDEARFQKTLDSYLFTLRYSPIKALSLAIQKIQAQAEINLRILGRLLIGKASIKNLGGPLTIADAAGSALESGSKVFVTFVASISLMLAVMNLLPIPVLDGGHMLFCLIEMAKGRALGERTQDVLLRLGLATLLTFMLFVLTIDVWRYLGQLF